MLGEIAPAYSIKPRRELNMSTLSPGPGKYESPRAFFQETTKFSFSRAPRGRSQNNYLPGPGQYDSQKPFYQEAATKSFAKAPRGAELKGIDPGPGSYDYVSGIGGGSSPLINSRLAGAARPDVPGPGQYDAHKPFYQEATMKSFSKAPRGAQLKGIDPGPGSYEHKSSIGGGSSPLVTSRSKAVLGMDVPGPGSYEPKVHDGSSKFSIRPKYSYQFRSLSPGPGSYDISQVDKPSPPRPL